MHDKFFGYYAPSQQDYQKLWKHALVVIDANVLLSLYRLPKTARDEFISVLKGLGDRIWVPYQVALEFQRNRLGVIANERRNTQAALEASGDLVEQIKGKVESLEMDKHGLGIEAAPLIADLESANSKLLEAIKAVHASQLEISANDPIREQIDKLIGDNVGTGPSSQEELDSLAADGEARYDARIPPGYSDANKEKNPANMRFVHDGISYEKKFGDLILWRQLLSHCSDNNLKDVLFVTSDSKEDWWWREQGKTVGPHPELIREARRVGNVEKFWMYSSGQFLEHAQKYTKIKVSQTSVAEVQNVRSYASAKLDELRYLDRWTEAERPAERVRYSRSPNSFEMRVAERGVQRWLEENHGGEVIKQSGNFPDLLAIKGDEIEGYEVKYTTHPDRYFQSAGGIGALSRGYLEMREGRLTEFFLVIVVARDIAFPYVEDVGLSLIRKRILDTLCDYPVSGIIVGTLREDGSFEVLFRESQ